MMDRAWIRSDGASLAVILLAVALGTSTIVSCGSGGGSSSNGELCQQCGDDPDGPCQPSVEVQPGTDVPACDNGGQPPCTVALECFRKLGSAQRRCFPENDLNFRCDGVRANRSTPGPTATPTATASGTVSQQTVTFTVIAPSGLVGFTLAVTYPTSKGTFAGTGLAVSCTTSGVVNQTFAASDDDAGTLTLQVLNNVTGVGLTTNIACVFVPVSGQTLGAGDLTFTSDSPITVSALIT